MCEMIGHPVVRLKEWKRPVETRRTETGRYRKLNKMKLQNYTERTKKNEISITKASDEFKASRNLNADNAII
jgi:hypothetical protein